MRFIQTELNGVRLQSAVFTRNLENRPAIVYLHGIKFPQNTFCAFLEDARLADKSAVVIQMIGFGDSEKPPAFSYDLNDQADVIINILRTLSLTDAIFVGHSMGGMVATLILKKAPQLVTRLISLEGNLVAPDCGESARVSKLSFNDFKKSYSGGKQAPDFAYYQSAKSIVKWASSGELLKTFTGDGCPKLLVLGEKSPFYSRAPKSPSVTTRVIPEATHFMLVERPTETVDAVVDFLQRHP